MLGNLVVVIVVYPNRLLICFCRCCLRLSAVCVVSQVVVLAMVFGLPHLNVGLPGASASVVPTASPEEMVQRMPTSTEKKNPRLCSVSL